MNAVRDLNVHAYEPSTLVEFADGEAEWFSPKEWATFDMPEDARVTALSFALDAPEGGITGDWRKVTGEALMRALGPAAVSWETLDESDDRDVSEFVIDPANGYDR